MITPYIYHILFNHCNLNKIIQFQHFVTKLYLFFLLNKIYPMK